MRKGDVENILELVYTGRVAISEADEVMGTFELYLTNLFLSNFGKFLKKHMSAFLNKVSRLGTGARLPPAGLG